MLRPEFAGAFIASLAKHLCVSADMQIGSFPSYSCIKVCGNKRFKKTALVLRCPSELQLRGRIQLLHH